MKITSRVPFRRSLGGRALVHRDFGERLGLLFGALGFRLVARGLGGRLFLAVLALLWFFVPAEAMVGFGTMKRVYSGLHLSVNQGQITAVNVGGTVGALTAGSYVPINTGPGKTALTITVSGSYTGSLWLYFSGDNSQLIRIPDANVTSYAGGTGISGAGSWYSSVGAGVAYVVGGSSFSGTAVVTLSAGADAGGSSSGPTGSIGVVGSVSTIPAIGAIPRQWAVTDTSGLAAGSVFTLSFMDINGNAVYWTNTTGTKYDSATLTVPASGSRGVSYLATQTLSPDGMHNFSPIDASAAYAKVAVVSGQFTIAPTGTPDGAVGAGNGIVTGGVAPSSANPNRLYGGYIYNVDNQFNITGGPVPVSFSDATVTGAISATSSSISGAQPAGSTVVAANGSGAALAVVSVGGTFTSTTTLSFEEEDDAGVWHTQGYTILGTSLSPQSTMTGAQGSQAFGVVAGFQAVRVRCTAFASDTPTVTIRLTNNARELFVRSPAGGLSVKNQGASLGNLNFLGVGASVTATGYFVTSNGNQTGNSFSGTIAAGGGSVATLSTLYGAAIPTDAVGVFLRFGGAVYWVITASSTDFATNYANYPQLIADPQYNTFGSVIQ